MDFEGFSSSKWSGLFRKQHSNRGSFQDGKRYEVGKRVQSAEAASGRKLVLLHDWWLVKADPDSHGKRLGIEGFTTKGNQGIRSFSSAAIIKRHDAVTLETVDGITLMVSGYVNRPRTLENGFSQEVCDHFKIGFPYYWEEFVGIPISEEQEPGHTCASKGVSPSDAYETPPAQEARGSNMMSGNSIDAIVTEAASEKKGAGGPLTRSRARLLATRRGSRR